MNTKHQHNYVKGKIWIEVEGRKFLGPGRIELLELIEQHGSISKAAGAMGMSYRKAWLLVDEMNEIARKPVVTTLKGGKSGGGAVVTEVGKKLMQRFKNLQHHFQNFLEKETKAITALAD